MMRRRWIGIGLLALLTGCAATPPPGWPRGGQRLLLRPIRWVNGEVIVDVDREGRILVNGEHVLGMDASGRLYDREGEPHALLDRDGYLHGAGDRPMGWVGGREAILPGDEHSWLVLRDGGLVVRFDDPDEPKPFGMWLGCPARGSQTCMLVSHVIGRRLLRSSRRRGVGVGLGMGLGVGIP